MQRNHDPPVGVMQRLNQWLDDASVAVERQRPACALGNEIVCRLRIARRLSVSSFEEHPLSSHRVFRFDLKDLPDDLGKVL